MYRNKEKDAQKRGAELLSDYLGRLSFDKIPKSAIHAAKRLIIDSMGCTLGGTRLPQGRSVIDLFANLSGKEECTIAGSSKRIPCIHAGYVNSYLGNLLDFDDTYFGHPGTTVIPPALALGEKLHLSGKDLIVGIIAGYEIGIRVADAIKPSRERLEKVWGLNTWQVFSSAAVSAKLLGLDREQMMNAFGLAGLNAPVPSLRKWGLENRELQWLKNNYGWTVMGGMLAAMMGKMGFIGDRTIFDGPKGFWIMASSDRYRPDLMESTPTSGKWAVEQVSLKPYTACRHLHPTLDAISAIVKEEGIEAKDVLSVDVKTFFEVVENWNFWPKDSFTIPFSGPLVIALTLSKIPTGLKWFDSKHLSDRKLRDLAARIRFRHWSEADSLYIEVKRELISNVRVKTKDGRLHAKEIRLPKGDPRNPMTDEELRGKFLSLAKPVLKSSRAEEIVRTVMNIEELKDCAHLSGCLGKQ